MFPRHDGFAVPVRFAFRTLLLTTLVWAAFQDHALGQACPTGMFVCPNENGPCTTEDGQEGFCHTTFLLPPGGSPFCDCQPFGSSNDPDLHVPIYRKLVEEDDVQLSASGDIQPGASLHFTGVLPAHGLVVKGATSQTVALAGASLDVQIGPTIDGTGRSTYVVTAGSGQFSPYVFGGQPVGTSNFTVERGSGWIRWSDGVMWGNMRVRTRAAGFADIVATAIGPASVNFTTDVVTLSPDAVAVEFQATPAPIPALSPWGSAVLTVLVLAAAAALLRRMIL